MIRDSAGNLYGTTRGGGTAGGAYGVGMVYKMSPAGHETVLYRFTGVPHVPRSITAARNPDLNGVIGVFVATTRRHNCGAGRDTANFGAGRNHARRQNLAVQTARSGSGYTKGEHQ